MLFIGPQEILLILIVLILLALPVIGFIVILWYILKSLNSKRESELEARVKELEKRLDDQQQKQ